MSIPLPVNCDIKSTMWPLCRVTNYQAWTICQYHGVGYWNYVSLVVWCHSRALFVLWSMLWIVLYTGHVKNTDGLTAYD